MKRDLLAQVVCRNGHRYRLALGECIIELTLEFEHLERYPEKGDAIMLSKNVMEGMKEQLYMYTFSTEIGAVYARPPHDPAVHPEEFIRIEYRDGGSVLLEQWYG